jgi:hypothetical protein
LQIPLNAKVECSEGMCGRSKFVLVNPVTDQVSHVVVEEGSAPFAEIMVPVDVVADTSADLIHLRCTKAELQKMEPFVKATVIGEKVPEGNFGVSGAMYGMGSFFFLPYVTFKTTVYDSLKDRQVPPGELAIHRGTRVEATDGFIGNVDEFVINPETGHITHLVMREGHLWGQKDVTIPLTALGETRDDTVFLTINKHEIETLPSVTVQRRWS